MVRSHLLADSGTVGPGLSRAMAGVTVGRVGKSPAVRLDLALGPFQFLDHLLTGIEDICGHYGHHHWKDK